MSRTPRALVAAFLAALAQPLVGWGQLPPAVKSDDTRPVRSSRIVLVVRTPGDERVVLRVRGELSSTSCQIVELMTDTQDPDVSLARMATLVSAGAALRVRADAGAVDVWVADPSGAASPVESIAVPGPRLDDRVLALRATEALRARGLRMDRRSSEEPAGAASSPSSMAPIAPSSPAARAAADAPTPLPPAREHASAPGAGQATTRARAIWAELGPASIVSPGGLRPSFDGWLGARAKIGRWSAGAFGLAPFVQQQIRAAEGTTGVSTFAAGGFFDLALVESTIELDLGAGLGGALTRMTGSAVSGYLGTTDTVIVATPFGRASAHYELGGGWRLSATTMLGTSLPEVSVRFVDREVASWGRPLFLLAMAGLEAPLFDSSSATRR